MVSILMFKGHRNRDAKTVSLEMLIEGRCAETRLVASRVVAC